ncbi:MIP18 family protein CG30152 isoform X2 [Zootermopsis nevadensis]|uniref:MIP18 family-like domain-containing protein n=1 Tax=Zootermopsis nevadensis TaxID=136037 RepID=A0A067R868_ZOONE|nr:MIP18 family protein CG30152 isoform X2 [Zootermopsis nevadensis]KDR19643.1 hypothetical protein L798_06164 [Zootermopsis nevadensis]
MRVKMLHSLIQKSKVLFGVKNETPVLGNETCSQAFENAVEATTQNCQSSVLDEEQLKGNEEFRDTIYDHIRNIRDPEKPATLEDLNVVYEDGVMIKPSTEDDVRVVRIEFNPTVPHCSLATLIGLCIRIKLERNLVDKFKLDIFIKKGTHSTEEEINKQINDKERIAAAMENPDLRDLVEGCIQEGD